MPENNISNIEVMLKHFMDTVGSRLDRMTDTLESLRDQKIVVEGLKDKVSSLEVTCLDLRDKVHTLEIESKRREEVSKSITNPIIQKAIWAAICAMFIVFAGYSVKGINIRSSEEMVELMKH
jgi:hypothetical protein